ncbi:sigma-70 family RNA polymerase sigma factor [Paraflavisolibacter sp. H34]|uniref:RNA polymerase sigma factor n=1 Tax=Huijunlia imazamoxiresistens TaxID=3127457 RepID=UPI0030162660
MKCVFNQEPISGQEILNKLRATGNERRKGESLLYQEHLYFLRVGMTKYPLTEDQLFDAYSDTILVALAAIASGTFEERASLKTYLFRIFHNKCIDLLRKVKTHKNSVHHTIDISCLPYCIPDNGQCALDRMIKKADEETFKQKIKKLPGKSQRLLQLSAEGYTDREIAVVMNFKTRDVVKASRLRCIQTLRQLNRAC